MGDSQVPGLFIAQQVLPNRLSSTQHRDAELGDPAVFAFFDIQANAVLPFHRPALQLPGHVKLTGIQLVSFSTHRDHFPVTSLGHSGIKGYTSGKKICAGTLGFSLLGEDPLTPILEIYSAWRGYTQPLVWASPDELPPFDLSLTMVSQTGNTAAVLIRSLKITDTARNISVKDIQFSYFYSFMATRITTVLQEPGGMMDRARTPRPSLGQEGVPSPNNPWNQTYITPYSFTTASTSTTSSSSSSTSSSTSTTSFSTVTTTTDPP